MEGAGRIHPSLGHQKMQMRMKIDAIAERLDGGDNPGLKRRPRHGLKIKEKRPLGTAAKIPQEPAFELEENPEHLGNREDHLAVRNIQKKRLSNPFTPFLKPLGMTGTISPFRELIVSPPYWL